jgi:uncharacterized protein (DUF4415 family)
VGRKKSKTDAPKEGSSFKQPSSSKPAPNTPRTRAAAAREAAAVAAQAAAAVEEAATAAEEEAAVAEAKSQAQPTPIPPAKRYVSSRLHVSSPYHRFDCLTTHPTIQEVALR